jgi:hypothetical protein
MTRENWLEKAVVRQGPTSIYYSYILYAGATPDEGPWMVEVHGNDVNWEYYPRTDDFSQEFADLDDALRYANGEDDSYFAESTLPARRSYWPWERPPSLTSLSNLVRGAHRRWDGDQTNLKTRDDRMPEPPPLECERAEIISVL